MLVLGLTGGIASGKSTVGKILTGMNAKMIDADQIARAVVLPDRPAWEALVAHFGEGILLPDRMLDRRKLGDRIFGDSLARAELNALLHPQIEAETRRQLAAHKKSGEASIVLDVPLLFEAGWERYTDCNWVVYAHPDTQLKRLMRRNLLSREQALARIGSQMPLEEKVKRADVVIDNNGGLHDTRRQVIAAWNCFMATDEKA